MIEATCLLFIVGSLPPVGLGLEPAPERRA